MKKALLVGINDYYPIKQGGPDLQGCINDVEDMANTLMILGFNAKSMRILTDGRATKQGILDNLQWLIKKSQKDDTLVFYYSGHGSQVPDLDGDEIDKKDEIICPHDTDFSKKTYIADDDFKKMFETIPAGVNLEIILDCCHSGTGTREILPKRKIRYLIPSFDYSFHIDYNPMIAARKFLKRIQKGKERLIVEGLNHVLWSGCKDNQTSEETQIDGKIRGVFTYHFCQILRRTNGNLKRKEMHQLLTGAIKRAGFSQVPQLESGSYEAMEKALI